MIFVKSSEGVARRWSVKKVFLEISQNLKENTCNRVSFLIKLQAVCNEPRREIKNSSLYQEFIKSKIEKTREFLLKY